jgi:UDP-N-acetylglucosamine 2-epimerase (non-hydrolysing)
VKIVHVVGGRPNFMKIAPTIAAIGAQAGVEQCLVHTGQHCNHVLSDVFFEELELPAPDHYLGVGSGSGVQAAGIMVALEPVLHNERPDARERASHLNPRAQQRRG